MTFVLNRLIKHTYQDSVVLMEISAILERLPGIDKAAVVMGSPAGMDMLRESGLLCHDTENIDEDDMVIAVAVDSDNAAKKAFSEAKRLLKGNALRKMTASGPAAIDASGPYLWRELPVEAQLAVISVPGQYAAAEAWSAMKANRHVLIFSDHVSLEDEIALKKAGKERNLLVMGPECGTAILGGVPLAFANQVRKGKIGIVAASGSGLQELTCLIDHLGQGISQAIGTGGRDLSLEVGGLTTNIGLQLLKEDPQTEVICILSKPPHPKIAEDILLNAKLAGKPVVACFIGLEVKLEIEGILLAKTIEEAALACVEIACGSPPNPFKQPDIEPITGRQRGAILGLFSGGTLAYEAMQILREKFGRVYSNAPLSPEEKFSTGDKIIGHTCLDLGAEEYTLGRPHPMIDGRWRAELVAQAGEADKIGVVLFDVILGTGSDPDPAGVLGEGILNAQEASQRNHHKQCYIASVTGTEMDSQSYSQQVLKLRSLGVVIAPTNASAARLAAKLVS